MFRSLPRRLGPAALPAAVALFLLPALLYLPVFYYSLTTPFALVDDYQDWQFAALLDSPEPLFHWLQGVWGWAEAERRYRPFWEFYNAVAWKVFGPNPALHHLSRWLFHFGAVFCFAAAFWRIHQADRRREISATDGPGWRYLHLLPLALLIYICLFFPNAPAARLAPQEVYTVFFLGLCNWMAVLLLTADRDSGGGRIRWWQSRRLPYALFVLAYLGLALSKEVNIAAALVLLVCWYPLVLARYGLAGRALLSGLPLLLIFGLALLNIYAAAQAGGVNHALTPELFRQNAGQIYAGLLQTETSWLIAAGFILLLLVLLTAVVGKIIRRRWDIELGFILLLLGQGLALSLLLSASYGVALRYWHILIPILAALLALGAGQLLRRMAARSPARAYGMGAALAAFILFFTAANYYDFLSQTIVQHSTRQVDAAAIAAAARWHDAGEYVHINIFGGRGVHLREEPRKLLGRYPAFAERFHNRRYAFHREPPTDETQPWYSVVWHFPPDILPTVFTRRTHENYPPLPYARRLAAVLQGQPPHQSQDDGAFRLGEYRISLFRRPVDLPALAARLREEADAAAEEGDFAVYLRDKRLIYFKEQCSAADTDADFRLHWRPVNVADLPPQRRELGFVNADFPFHTYGLRVGTACLAGRELPDYPILSLLAGQSRPDGELLWESRLFLNPTAAIRAGEWGPPLARNVFDLYRQGNTLAYIKEQCSPADTAARFFLHLTPPTRYALPPERREYGFVSMDFNFADYGVREVATCLAVRELPDYAAGSRISAGQFHPDTGELWRVELGGGG